MVPPTCGYIFKEYSVGRVKNKKNGSSHPDEGDGCPEGAVGLAGRQGGHDGLVPETMKMLILMLLLMMVVMMMALACITHLSMVMASRVKIEMLTVKQEVKELKLHGSF